MPSNINPSLEPTKSLVNFRFWCQKVLPLVYDDSLSYYEVLGKMVVQLNDVIDDVNADIENVDTLKEAFLALQTYVNEFFDDIDQLASYAERAEAAQTAANTSAINAASSASNASASSLAAMNARDTAVTAREAAQASANTATTASENATTKASEAAQSAITAQTAQASASQSATLAATDRSAAQTAASTATTKANEANQSAESAAQSATEAAESAEGIISIQNPLMPNDFYGDDFVDVINGITITKKGNRINFKGTQTRDLTIRPFSNDHLAHNQYIKPPILNINRGTPPQYIPNKIILESTLINNRQDSPSQSVFIYSNLNTIINGQDNFLIRQYLRANNPITGGLTTWIMSSAVIDENLINTGLAIDLYVNCPTLEVDFDIIFNIRGSSDAYLL